jgi:glutaredoxin
MIPSVEANQQGLNIYFFHSKTCPHCREQTPLMNQIATYNEDVKLIEIEVNEQAKIWQEFREKNQIKSGAVPRTVIGNKHFIGYSPDDGPLEYNPVYQGYIGFRNQIILAIEQEINHPLSFSLETSKSRVKFPPWLVFLLPLFYLLTYPFLQQKIKTKSLLRIWISGLGTIILISIFSFLVLTPETLIKNFAQELPFPLFVTTIALVDGFNPCAFTVLIILLSLLTYTKSKRQMTWIGSTFILTSAVMYFIFIILMMIVGSFAWEKFGNLFLLITGLIVTIAGLINLKDYFFFKQGFSLTLSSKQQLLISQKAKNIVNQLTASKNNKFLFFTALGGTVILGIFVNLIELGCTAILPVIYLTSLLQYCQTKIGFCVTFWTGIYALVYILPLLAILVNFIYFFKSSRLTPEQGKILKLVGGLFMIIGGLLMIFKPQWLMFV